MKWTATGNTAGGKAMLDAFTGTASTSFQDIFGLDVPALFFLHEQFTLNNTGRRTKLTGPPSTPVEILIPGPSLFGSDLTTGTLYTHSGLLAKPVYLSSSPEVQPLYSYPLTALLPATLEEALDWPRPVTTSGGWIGLTPGAGAEDFAVASGNSPQWIETTVTGPGILAWDGQRMDWGHAIPPAIMTVDGVQVNPGSLAFGISWHFLEARDYTVRWTVDPSNMVSLDRLHWTPYTPENNFSAWVMSLGLTGADASPGADPDLDGRNNMLEFAFGTNAAAADADASPVPVIIRRNDREYAALEFRCRNIPGIHFEMQEGGPPPLLPGWRSSTVEVATPSGDGLFLTHRWMRLTPLPADPTERRTLLLRMQVSLLP